MRSTTTAEVLSLEDGQEEPPVALIEVDGEPAEQSFLWEQIASSLDEVELHEVRRVVGEVLVQSLEDVYSEVRALVDILDEYSAVTNDLVSRAVEQRQVLGSPAGGLLQQELRHLVRHLGSISAAHGAPADALLPPVHSKQRQSLDVLLRAEGELSRPRTASSVESRESVRHLRCVGHASEGRPCLAGNAAARGTLPACQKAWGAGPPPLPHLPPPRLRASRGAPKSPRLAQCDPPNSTPSSNGRSVGCSRPGTASRPSTASRPGTGVSGGGGGGGGSGGGGGGFSSRPQTSGSAGSSQGRPQTNDSVGRPTTGASTGSTSNAESGGGGDGGVVAEAVAGGRGGAVIAQLRAALEEERRALLVQAEQLRLSLDDECDYREESAVPPPSVPEMTQLKLALQDSLARAEHAASAPALRASLGSRDHDRRALNRLKPLPPSEPKQRAPSARDRLRGMVDEAREEPDW